MYIYIYYNILYTPMFGNIGDIRIMMLIKFGSTLFPNDSTWQWTGLLFKDDVPIDSLEKELKSLTFHG